MRWGRIAPLQGTDATDGPGDLIHMLRSKSWDHTCKPRFISFIEAAEQAELCPCSSSIFTSKVSSRHGNFPLKTIPISILHEQKYSQRWQFLTAPRKAGCGGPHLSAQFLRRWVGAHEPGTASQVSSLTGTNLTIPERSAGCIRRAEPTWVAGRAPRFLPSWSSLPEGMALKVLVI